MFGVVGWVLSLLLFGLVLFFVCAVRFCCFFVGGGGKRGLLFAFLLSGLLGFSPPQSMSTSSPSRPPSVGPQSDLSLGVALPSRARTGDLGRGKEPPSAGAAAAGSP